MEKNVNSNKCKNSEFFWHQVDGCCKECAKKVTPEIEKKVADRRDVRGYR